MFYKEYLQMSWAEKMKEFGGADLTFLSEDGEALSFVVVGDPLLLEGKYKGQPSKKIACPVVTSDGFQLFIAGTRLARRISKHEKDFKTHAFMAIRHGLQEDSNTTYELRVIDDKEVTQRLFQIAKKEFKPDMITEAVEAAKDVMTA